MDACTVMKREKRHNASGISNEGMQFLAMLCPEIMSMMMENPTGSYLYLRQLAITLPKAGVKADNKRIIYACTYTPWQD